MRTVVFSTGEEVPALGQGTWKMGESHAHRKDELAALRLGIDLGMRVIDTAEMYGEGAAEKLIAEAIAGRRDEVFLVSKVYPHNADIKSMAAACERSLRRLQTDRIDLYLLHWRSDIPMEETIAGFLALQRSGKIRHFGVSNFDLQDMHEWWQTDGGCQAATNQVLYNLSRRGIEWDLLPWCREHRLPVMAYSPMEQARLLRNGRLKRFASEHGMSAGQVALAWLLARENVLVIPKSGHPEHVRENFVAAQRGLSPEQLIELDELFPPPKAARSLDML